VKDKQAESSARGSLNIGMISIEKLGTKKINIDTKSIEK
jgi:hypothetical protein